MTNGFAMISCSDGKPPGPNCNGPYPWAIKGCREYFSGDVERPVHVGIDQAVRSHLQVVLDTPIAFFSQLLKFSGSETILFGKLSLEGCTPFVVLLVPCLERTPVNEKGSE